MKGDPRVIADRLLQRGWNRDGLPEIGVGLTFLVTGALIYAQEVLPRRSPGQVAAVLAFAFGLPVVCFGLPPLVKRVRGRWLVERSGYVEHVPSSIRRNYVFALALSVMAVVLPLAFLVVSRRERLLLPITGALGGLLCGWIGWRGRMYRVIAGGALLLMTAIWLALGDLPVPIAMAILFGSQGLYYLAAGGIAFARLIHDER